MLLRNCNGHSRNNNNNNNNNNNKIINKTNEPKPVDYISQDK